MKNIVILISGSGSNMTAIIQKVEHEDWQAKFSARIAAVITNKPDANGLILVNAMGIETKRLNHATFATGVAFDAELMQKIDIYAPVLVVLAGFMRILTSAFVAHYAGRLVNIHPSLLPAFPGLNTHQRAIDAGCKLTGATVHFVTENLDIGPILALTEVTILPSDTAKTLATRVQIAEHIIYPQAIAQLLASM